jgi:hypothetical protein
LREERRLGVSGYKVLRRIFRPKRDEIIWEWKKLHKEELSRLYSSPKICWVVKSRIMRRAAQVARMGESTVLYRVLTGKTVRKRPIGRPRL